MLEHLRSGVISLWESRDHTDVTLVVAGTRIPAHRVILASQSEYFDRLLFGEMREAHAGAEIPLPDTPLEAFQLLLQYAYCGSLEMKTAQLQVGFALVFVSATKLILIRAGNRLRF